MKRIHSIRKKIVEGNHMQSVKLEDADEHVCLNCGTKFRGDYCPACKQKATTKRLNISDTLKNGVARFTKIDSGFLHTVVDLMYRPGYMVRDYIQGYRIEYIEPLMLLIILLAMSYLIPSVFPDDLHSSLPESWNTQLAPYPISLTIAKALVWMESDEQRIVLFFGTIFAIALTHTLKIIRTAKEHVLNVSESIHLILYFACFTEIMGMVLDLILLALPDEWVMSEDTYITVFGLISIVVLVIMVRDCTQIRRGRLAAFVFLFPILAMIYVGLFLFTLRGITFIEMPWELAKEIDILEAGLK